MGTEESRKEASSHGFLVVMSRASLFKIKWGPQFDQT